LRKRPFGERPRREQVQLVGWLTLSLGLVAVAQNDLRRRPASQIRGRKTIWRLVSLNALGALVYLCFGRARKQRVAGSGHS
jgi:hypothetical protein